MHFTKFFNLPTINVMEYKNRLSSNQTKKAELVHRWLEPLYVNIVYIHGSTKPSISLNNWSIYQQKKTSNLSIQKADLLHEHSNWYIRVIDYGWQSEMIARFLDGKFSSEQCQPICINFFIVSNFDIAT